MTHTSTNSHAVLIAELASLREAAREAEKALHRSGELLVAGALFGKIASSETVFYDEAECDGECFATDCGIAADDVAIALTRLRESLKGIAAPIRWERHAYGTGETGIIDGIKVANLSPSLTRGVDGFTVWTIGLNGSERRYPLEEAKRIAQERVDSLVSRLASRSTRDEKGGSHE